jgi:excisionase family DNA binding protein
VPDNERLLSREEVAVRLGLSKLTVGTMLREGRLPGFHLGRLWRVREEDLNEYVRRIAEEGAIQRAARAAKAKGARELAARVMAAKAERQPQTSLAMDQAEEESGPTMNAYDQAAERIDETPALEPYRATILADSPEGDAHFTWAATCDFAELLSWAEAATPCEDGQG